MLKRTLALLLAILLLLSCAMADTAPDIGYVFNDTEDDTEAAPDIALMLEDEDLNQTSGVERWDYDIDCGDLGGGIEWHYTDENVLFITGLGAMPDFEADADGLTLAPWRAYASEIKAFCPKSLITKIGANALRGCTALTEIWGWGFGSVKIIGNYAFSGCTSLRVATGSNYNPFVFAGYGSEFNLPIGLQTLGTGAFSGCTSLRSVTIFKDVKNWGACVFEGCTNLKKVIFEGDAPSVAKGMFSGCTLTASIDRYTSGWTESKKASLSGTVTWEIRGLLAPENIYGMCTSGGNALIWPKVEDADGYQILRSTSDDPDDLFTPIKSVTGNSTVTAKPAAGTTYYYKVRAYKLVNGKKEFSLASTYMTRPENLTPVIGTTVSIGTKAYLEIDFRNGDDLTFIDGYQLWRSTAKSGTYTSLKSVTGQWRNGTITNLPAAGATYYYKARPFMEIDGTRIYGDYCTPFAVKPLGKITTAAAIRSGSTVNMAWTKLAAAAGYQIVRSTAKNGTYSSIKRVADNYTGTAAPTSGTYYYKIRPYITMGGSTYYGEYSSPVAITTMAKPAITSATAQVGKAALKWSAVSGASGYTVYRSTSQSGTYIPGKSLTDLSWTVGNLTSGTTYWFKIKPYKLVEGQKIYGEFSAAKSVTVK